MRFLEYKVIDDYRRELKALRCPLRPSYSGSRTATDAGKLPSSSSHATCGTPAEERIVLGVSGPATIPVPGALPEDYRPFALSSPKPITDDYRRELKALKAIINITFNSITSNPGESRRSNTSTG